MVVPFHQGTLAEANSRNQSESTFSLRSKSGNSLVYIWKVYKILCSLLDVVPYVRATMSLVRFSLLKVIFLFIFIPWSLLIIKIMDVKIFRGLGPS